VDWRENLFVDKRPVHATSWIDRWSTREPGVKADMIETGHGRGRIAVDEDAVWVANETSETLTRIDRRTALPDWRADLDRQPLAVATGTEAAWVLGEERMAVALPPGRHERGSGADRTRGPRPRLRRRFGVGAAG
jgi:hypothetical protein